MTDSRMKLNVTFELRSCSAIQQGQAASFRRLTQEECHGHKEPVEQERLLHA